MGYEHEKLVRTAQEYCRLIESADADDDGWLAALGQILPRLHAHMAALESPAGDEANPDSLLDLDSRFELFSRLHETLGERDSYWLEFDVPREDLPASGSLADDLTDIYCDLKLGLKRLAANDDPDRTLGDWRAGFSVHWGQHLVDAERHLYALNTRSRPV